MIIDPKQRSSSQLYSLMVSTVVPRPIAWVSTQSPSGVTNLAPFSYFNVVSSRPPLVSICIGQRKWNGEWVDKDTLRNIRDTGELVINMTCEENLGAVNDSAAEYPPDMSEVSHGNLATLPSDLVAPPRIAASPVHYECKLERLLAFGDDDAVTMVIAEVVRFHVDDSVWDADTGTADPVKLRPLGRLGGTRYAGLGEIVIQPRAVWPGGK